MSTIQSAQSVKDITDTYYLVNKEDKKRYYVDNKQKFIEKYLYEKEHYVFHCKSCQYKSFSKSPFRKHLMSQLHLSIHPDEDHDIDKYHIGEVLKKRSS